MEMPGTPDCRIGTHPASKVSVGTDRNKNGGLTLARDDDESISVIMSTPKRQDEHTMRRPESSMVSMRTQTALQKAVEAEWMC